MKKSLDGLTVLIGGVGFALAAHAGGPWAEFDDHSATRMISDPSLGTDDTQEKDYAWGDIDNDGDIDLVVVRKLPFTNSTGRPNVLFMNEGVAEGHAVDGVLVDRSETYASASDNPGQGFLDATNDRDVVMADLNNDGWLDVVTAPAYHSGEPKYMSHPRVYMNLGEENGEWLGLRHEVDRMPTLNSHNNSCGVHAGDVTGDGFADLYFVDYDSFTPNDHEDLLLINDGNGFFTDETTARLSSSSMYGSSFGSATEIRDMNGDGWNDIVKSENGPVEVIYNDGDGFFNDHETPDSSANYHTSVADLNNDGKLDLVNTSDGTDRYQLNQGNGGDGLANFSTTLFSGDDGFGGNSVSADLDNDGWLDVLITDCDVDIGGCSRRLHIYHNDGNAPNVDLNEEGTLGIPTNMLTGTHDVAVFDLNQDGLLDLVIGRCSGTQVWTQQSQAVLTFEYPDGRPQMVEPGVETGFSVSIGIEGEGKLVEDSVQLRYSIDGGPLQSVPATALGGGLYEVSLPALECAQELDYFLIGQIAGGGSTTDPPGAPDESYSVIAAAGTTFAVNDALEGDTSGWTVDNAAASGGGWEAAAPNGTINNGQFAAPLEDHTADGSVAFVTENAPSPGAPAGNSDVDGGLVRLITPTFDLAGTDGTISFAMWFYTAGGIGDRLIIEISNDGGENWTFVDLIGESTQVDGETAWTTYSFTASAFVETTDQMAVRFSTSDPTNDSITEAAIDDFTVERFECGSACPADLDGSSSVDVSDLLELLAAWGECGEPCPADLDGSSSVDVSDLLELLAAWGECG